MKIRYGISSTHPSSRQPELLRGVVGFLPVIAASHSFAGESTRSTDESRYDFYSTAQCRGLNENQGSDIGDCGNRISVLYR